MGLGTYLVLYLSTWSCRRITNVLMEAVVWEPPETLEPMRTALGCSGAGPSAEKKHVRYLRTSRSNRCCGPDASFSVGPRIEGDKV